jgi:hypothetical protein
MRELSSGYFYYPCCYLATHVDEIRDKANWWHDSHGRPQPQPQPDVTNSGHLAWDSGIQQKLSNRDPKSFSAQVL